jgi:uncharacterized protein RhaS with RHS repeats
MSSPLWQSGQALTDDPITLSSVGGTTYTGPYTINTSDVTSIANPWATNATLKSPRIQLNGPDADIEVNGESLMATLSIIKERLNYLQVNTELEAEWNELRELGEQYRQLEQHIRDKQDTWNRLKAMSPPETD